MKTRGFVVTMFAVALSFTAQFVDSSSAASGYSAQLISPTAGQVLYPGQQVRVEWEALFPKLGVPLSWCEMEVFLSLDGGRTFNMCISVSFDPKATFFYWTVPNTPTNTAVLDVRFGCEQFYPETPSVQSASSFVIGQSATQ
jgi:hypothetical protein